MSTQTPPGMSVAVLPFAWLPEYLPDDEMAAVWREWGWRILGREPVAEKDREAFEKVCRQLHTNWGAVYRPVALLPSCNMTMDQQQQNRRLNQCLAAGWSLRQRGLPINPDTLAAETGMSLADIVPCLPRILTLLDEAEAHTMRGATDAKVIS